MVKADRIDVLYGARGIGRPVVIGGKRKLVSFYVFETQWAALKEIRDAERARREKAGDKHWRQVSTTTIVSEALREYIKTHHK